MSATDALGALFSSLRERFGFPADFESGFVAAVRGFQRSPLPTREEIKHSERLEFLGDSCLQFCITRILHREFPEEDEGVLSSVKGSIVSGASLAEVAEALGFARAAPGATPARLKSYLPDAFEAFLGAWFLHAGISEVGRIIDALFADHAKGMVSSRSFKSLKSMIQEIAAKELGADPQYKFQRMGAENKYRAFVVLGGKRVAQGTGGSKKEAEDKALERLFPRLNEVFEKMGKLPGRRGASRRSGSRGRSDDRSRSAGRARSERSGRGDRDRQPAPRDGGQSRRAPASSEPSGASGGQGQRRTRRAPARRPAPTRAPDPAPADAGGWEKPAEKTTRRAAETRARRRPPPADKAADARAAGAPQETSPPPKEKVKKPVKKPAEKPADEAGGWSTFGPR